MKILTYKGAKLNIRLSIDNLNKKELELLTKAVIILGKAVNSEAFKLFVVNYSWSKKIYKKKWLKKIWVIKSGNNFRYNKGLSNQEVFNKIINGTEILDNIKDNEIDIFLKIDRKNKRNVIGYTYSSTKWQWIYSWVLKKYDEFKTAGNLIHEWCHKIGFNHEFKYNPLREFTVPYAVGYFISNFHEMFKNQI